MQKMSRENVDLLKKIFKITFKKLKIEKIDSIVLVS